MSEKIPMLELHAQYLKIKAEVDAALSEVIDGSAFVNGAVVRRFEEALARYLGCKHVVACGNGTDALQISFLSLGLQPGDEVITTPFTFIATAEAAALFGIRPVFVDVDNDTFNMDVSQVERAVTDRTRAILPVHLFGQCAEMEPLLEIARRRHLRIIEDACQAIGAEYAFSDGKRRRAGTMGDLGCTSFFPSKNLGCFGDGGALFTNDDELAARARRIANHGASVKYHHEQLGMNSRLDSLQAAVLEVKLRHLDEYTKARQTAAARYDRLLADCPGIVTPKRSVNSTHVYHQYTMKVPAGARDQLRTHLQETGIATAIYYPVPLHLQPAFAYLGYRRGDFPVAEKLADSVLSLPMHTELMEEQQKKICQILAECSPFL
ncbi:MAG: DegT/DnrJ/EryC1/StrS family aminotransferase [Bacteroidales bacterium]|nr:DegT/DnrJ/EryC1/StrS family aminotransferase [Bacteroidales bacterium]